MCDCSCMLLHKVTEVYLWLLIITAWLLMNLLSSQSLIARYPHRWKSRSLCSQCPDSHGSQKSDLEFKLFKYEETKKQLVAKSKQQRWTAPCNVWSTRFCLLTTNETSRPQQYKESSSHRHLAWQTQGNQTSWIKRPETELKRRCCIETRYRKTSQCNEAASSSVFLTLKVKAKSWRTDSKDRIDTVQ